MITQCMVKCHVCSAHARCVLASCLIEFIEYHLVQTKCPWSESVHNKLVSSRSLTRGSFMFFVELVQFYLAANCVAEGKHAVVLLSEIGKETYLLLKNLLVPSTSKNKTFDKIVSTLRAHFEPKPLVIAEQFSFHRRDQSSGDNG